MIVLIVIISTDKLHPAARALNSCEPPTTYVLHVVTQVHTHTHTPVWLFLCMSVCLCVRESKSQLASESMSYGL